MSTIPFSIIFLVLLLSVFRHVHSIKTNPKKEITQNGRKHRTRARSAESVQGIYGERDRMNIHDLHPISGTTLYSPYYAYYLSTCSPNLDTDSHVDARRRGEGHLPYPQGSAPQHGITHFYPLSDIDSNQLTTMTVPIAGTRSARLSRYGYFHHSDPLIYNPTRYRSSGHYMPMYPKTTHDNYVCGPQSSHRDVHPGESTHMRGSTRGAGHSGAGEYSSSDEKTAPIDGGEKMTVRSGDRLQPENVEECCTILQELLDIALNSINKMVHYWTGKPELIKEMIIQATTAFSIIYNMLSVCKSKLLSLDPTNSWAMTVASGPRFDEESILNCEKYIKISDLIQYGEVLATISKLSSEMKQNSVLVSKVSELMSMEQKCSRFSLKTCIRSLFSILNIESKVIGLESEKLQLAVDVFTVNKGFDESEQKMYDKYVLGVSVLSPKEHDHEDGDS